MIDTNQIQRAGEVVAAVKSQVQSNWPAISAVAFIVAREITNFNRWARNVAEFIISHGGIGWLLWKLIYNPPSPPPKA